MQDLMSLLNMYVKMYQTAGIQELYIALLAYVCVYVSA
jgi:hypothetical protein